MNALKNILFFGLLIAVLFGVYISLNKQPEQQPLPPGLSGDTSQPQVVVPGINDPASPSGSTNSAAGQTGFPPANAGTTANNAPDSAGGMPPPYTPPATDPGASPAPRDRFADRGLAPPPATDFTPPPPPGETIASLPPPPATNDQAIAGGPSARASASVAANNGSAVAPPWQRPDASPAADPNSTHVGEDRLDMILRQVKINVDNKEYAKALVILSGVYDNPDLPSAKAQAITQILDYLAAKVIYSREHLLEPLYVVPPGDTLNSIADHYQVPSLLLAKINGIRDPNNLPPGTKLKVLKGPFSAFVNLEHGELTMKLDGRYAGRFPLALSSDLQRASGLYTVREKSPPAAAGRPAKPWIELYSNNGVIGIEGAPDLHAANRDGHSTMWLSDQDMDDVYGILSVGSRVVIQR